jgi:Protein kinase domain
MGEVHEVSPPAPRAPGATADGAESPGDEGDTPRMAADDLPEGAEIGGYTVIGLLGRGAMGAVYEAVDGGGHAVAVKLLHAHLDAGSEGRERLRREVAALQRLRHPAVAQVLDAELDGPQAFVVTELVDGPTLEEEIDNRGPLDSVDLFELADQLADALEAVHASGVVHRDLKPSNVLVTRTGPVLIDFGIAHGPGDARATSTGFVMGTPGYLAPELLDGAPPEPDTDWWSWAALLAFAATGRSPFGVRPTELVLRRSREGRPDLVGVPARTARALAGALQSDPGRRWGPTEVARALRRDADDVVRAARASGVVPDGEATQRIMPVAATQAVATPAGAAPPAVVPPGEDPARRRTAAEREEVRDGITRSVPAGGRPAVETARYRPFDALEDVDEEAEPPAPYVRPTHRRRAGTVLAAGLPLVALAATRPGVAFAVLAGLVVLCRIVAASSGWLHERRERRGSRRGSDGVLAGLLTPWHAFIGAIGAVPALLVGGCVGVLAVVGGYWLFGDGRLIVMPMSDVASRSVGGRNAPIVFCAILAVAMVLALLGVWFGPAGRPAREGARTVLAHVAPGLLGAAIVVVGCLVLAWILSRPLLEVPPEVLWWPFSGPPDVS